jgi:glyceraldehyde 3-phosphate dehydrogenase
VDKVKTKIAINGFGRIGRNAFKIAFERPDIEIVAVNDLTDTKTLAHLLKHDSNYGTYQHDVGADEQNIIVDGKPIRVLAEKEPEALPWGDLGVDVVIESTGFFTKHEDLKKHITAGAKKVVLSAPEKDDDDHDTFVIGVNEQNMKPEHQIFSNASCTTNCITPVAAIIETNFGIEKAMMTTVHSYTASQKLQDAPAKDLREARNAAENIVPTSTGASIAAAKALPALEGIFGGMSIRVPTPVVSLSDFAIVTKRAVTEEEVNEVFKKAASEPYYQGILEVTEEELVSSDFIGNSHSAIVDLSLTKVVGGNLLKVVAWYDNEWGYSNRLVELTADVGKLIHNEDGGSEMGDKDTDNNEQPAIHQEEKQLEAPSVDDFLPPAEPHNTQEEHQPVEGAPSLGGPGDTLPEQEVPSAPTLPDSEPAGPDKPHQF